MQQRISALTHEAVALLSELIALPGHSREETKKADFIEDSCRRQGFCYWREGNNLCATSRHWHEGRPTVLLNAHIDTVRPVDGWQHHPYTPTLEHGRLYGLGANDCGGGLVSLLQVFRLAEETGRACYNLRLLLSAEEEVSGKNGMERVVPRLLDTDFAIVGEPTGMQPAIAEKGLMVLDCTAHGVAGHAARQEGVNAIYEALADIAWFRTHRFSRVSPLLGPVKMSVTVIQAGTQHNVMPDTCRFTVDVRSNECYTNAEILDEIVKNVRCEVHARSTRLGSSGIALEHPFVQKVVALGRTPYGSPTLSDQALMPWPSLKLGPGDSARSHTADEYVEVSEIHDGIADFYTLLTE